MKDSEIKLLNNEFNNLSEDEKKELTNENARVAPLIIWAAKVLAGAGLSWLAKKLLDWGAVKFCKTYRNSNWATKKVCAVIA